jgi:hypothetical protein
MTMQSSWRSIMLLLLFGCALPCMAADPVFQFSKPIERATAGESILAVPLDADVYSATRPELPDLRVLDAADQEVPCLIEKATEPRTQIVRSGCSSKVVSLKEQGDSLEVLVRLEADAPAADGVDIVTPLTDFERRVSVFGSDDGMRWTPLVSGSLVFDYSRYMDISNREIRLPRNRFRQFRISIAGIADAKESPFLDLTRKYRGANEAERTEKTVLERRPFHIDRIELWHEQSEKTFEYDRKIGYKPAGWRVVEDTAKKSTIVEVSMRREPITELTLETSSRNFSRTVEVQVPVRHDGRTQWREIGRGTVSLVDFGGYHRATLGVSFPQNRQSDYRLVIRNEDNRPLAITGVNARGNVYRVVFLTAKDETYRLAYGSDEAKQPRYDAAVVLAPLRQGHGTREGQLGPQTAVAAVPQPPEFDLRRLLNSPLFLGPVIVALVALLGWGLVRAARRIDEIPKE